MIPRFFGALALAALLLLLFTAPRPYGFPYGHGGAGAPAPPSNVMTALLASTGNSNVWLKFDSVQPTNSTLSTVFYSCDTPTSCPPSGSGPQTSGSYGCVVSCGTAAFFGSNGPETTLVWGSCVYNPRDDEMDCKGSGHLNYAGNEIYAFSLATGRWRIVTVPNKGGSGSATNPGYTCGLQTGAGWPSPQHEYNGLFWDSVQGKLGEGPQGCADQNVYFIDPATQSPSAFGTYTAGGTPVNFVNATAQGVFDAGLGSVGKFFTNYCQECNGNNFYGLQVYDNSLSPGSRWVNVGLSESGGIHRTAALDPVHHLMISFGGGVSGILNVTSIGDIYNLSTGAVNQGCNAGPNGISTFCFTTTSGVTTCNNLLVGIDWDSVINKFIFGCGGTALYTMDISGCTSSPCTPVVAALTINGANTVTPTCATNSNNCENGAGGGSTGVYMQNGINGTFRYVSAYHAVVWVNGATAPTYVFKCDGVQC